MHCGMQGSALVGDPARAIGSFRDIAKAQPQVPLIYFYMEYINQQNKTKSMWIQADIPCIHLTPNQYDALALAIIYTSNNVTTTGNFMTSQVNGPLARYAKSRVRMRWECRERFPRHRR